MKLQNPLHEITFQMRNIGGAFVRSLVRPLELADPENQAALIQAFPAIFERYDALATATKNEKRERIEANLKG